MNLEKFTISLAQAADIDKFSEILIRDQVIAEEHRQMIIEVNVHYFQDPNILIWLAYCGHRPIGMLWLILDSDRKDMSNGEDLAELHQFRVLADFRGQKVGSWLYRTVEAEAKRRSFRTLTLAVEKDNLSAQNIYAHWGFRAEGTRIDDFGGEIVESVRMVKSLEDFDTLYQDLVNWSLPDQVCGEWEL